MRLGGERQVLGAHLSKESTFGEFSELTGYNHITVSKYICMNNQ